MMTQNALTVQDIINHILVLNGQSLEIKANISQVMDRLLFISRVTPSGEGIVSSFDINLKFVGRINNGYTSQFCSVGTELSKPKIGIEETNELFTQLKLFNSNEMEIPVYLIHRVENLDEDSFVDYYYAVNSIEKREGFFILNSNKDLEVIKERYYSESIEEATYAKTVKDLKLDLSAFDLSMPLSIWVEKREPEYVWEPDEGEMEYYTYFQSQLITKNWYHCLFPVQTLFMRDGDCMFVHQDYSSQKGMTVADALIALEQFNPDEIMGMNIELNNGNRTATPHYFMPWGIEQKDGHCVLIANANHEGLGDTRIVNINPLSEL